MHAKKYEITLTGETPLLFHKDNTQFSEQIQAWRKAPENKVLSVAGDDRSPAWTWIGYLYESNGIVGIDADCLMSTLREGGGKIRTGKKNETFKKATQSGIMVNEILWPLVLSGGKTLKMNDVNKLIGETNFEKHEEFAKAHGFDLFVKRAKVGMSKHVRVRPMFEHWSATGTITVLDEEQSGITQPILEKLFEVCGTMVGLCDWRPGGSTPGRYGKFSVVLTPCPR